MAAKIADLIIDLKADIAQFQTSMNTAGKHVEDTANRINKAFDSIGKGLQLVVAGAAFHRVIEETTQAENAIRKVEGVLRSTGNAAGVTKNQVQDLANEIESLTGVDGDLVTEAEAMLLTFTKIGKDVFPEATRAIVDMASFMGTDLKTATIQVGKALNDPIKGIQALQKEGVAFTEGQKAVIKSLVETGHAAEAQKAIIAELETEFGGAASVARDTLGGALKALDTSFGNLMAMIGSSDGGGLRYAIELLIAVLDELSNHGQECSDFMKGFGEVTREIATQIYTIFRPGLNNLVNAFIVVGQVISDVCARAQISWANLQKLLHGKDDFEHFTKLTDYSELLNQFKKDSLKAPEDAWKNFTDGVNKKLEKMHENATRARKSFQGLSDDLQAPEKKKKGGKDPRDILSPEEWDFIEKMKQNALEREADSLKYGGGDKSVEDDLKRFKEWASGGSNKLDDKAALKQQEDLAAQRKERNELLATMDQQIEKQKALNAHDEHALRLAEAQMQIAKFDKLTTAEKDQLLQSIVQHEEELAKLQDQNKFNERIEDMRRETEALLRKVQGTDEYKEALIKLQGELEKTNLAEADKAEIINKTRELLNLQRQYNEELKNQRRCIDDIVKSDNSYLEKLSRLKDALRDGRINQDQFNETLKNLQDTQIKKAQDAITSWSSKLVNDFGEAITSGKKLSDVFKDLGKQLAELAAKKLLFEPIAKGISGIANWIWGGSSQQGGFGGIAGLFGQPNYQSGSNAGGGGGLGGLGGGLLGMLGGLFRGGTSGGSMPPVAPQWGGGPVGPISMTQNPLLNMINNPMQDLLSGGGGGAGAGGWRSSGGGSNWRSAGGMQYGNIGGYGAAAKQVGLAEMHNDALNAAQNMMNMKASGMYDPDLMTGWMLNSASQWQNAELTSSMSRNFSGYYRPSPGQGASYAGGWGSAGNASMLAGINSMMGMGSQQYGGSGFVPGLTGGVNKSPLWAPYNYGDYSTQKGGIVGPYFGKDAFGTATWNPSYPSYPKGTSDWEGSYPNGLSAGPMWRMRGYAEGGRTPINTPVMVGERGPEIFTPDVGGSITPNNKLGGAGGGVPAIHIHNNTGTQIAEPDVQMMPDGNLKVMLDNAMQQGSKSPKFQKVLTGGSNYKVKPVKKG